LLNNIYKKYVWLGHWHHPQPYLKKTLHEVYEAFEEEMMACSQNRFRSNNDLTQYIYRYWHLTKNEFSPCKCDDGYDANIVDETSLNQIIDHLKYRKNIHFVGFNDHIRNYREFENIKRKLRDFLETVFPDPASFEVKKMGDNHE